MKVIRATFVNEIALINHIRKPVGHPCIGWQSITTSSSCFLKISFNGFRHIRMRNKAHIGFVNTHTKSNCRHHHDIIFALECSKSLSSLLIRKTGMVKERMNAFTAEIFANGFACLSSNAVNNAALPWMLCLNELREL